MNHDQAQGAAQRGTSTWVFVATVLVLASGMAYTLWWGPVVRGIPIWLEPGDTWGIVRGAHWIDWGGFSYFYSAPRTGILTLPGFELVLAPVVALTSALHLTETAPGLLPIPHPQAWLVVGPVFFATSGVALYALDSAATALGIAPLRRRVLLLVEAAALWPTLALWGHPEDVLALGLAVLAIDMAHKGRWSPAAWLLGGAAAMQLYVIALVPIFIAVAGWRKVPALLARAAVLPGFLLAAVGIPNPHATFYVLTNQPAFPKMNHATPWVGLAPKLAAGIVAGGPERLVGFAVAIGAALFVAVRRCDLADTLWLAALVLSARYIFESVDVPYYLCPAIVVALVSAMRCGRTKFAATCAIGATLVRVSYFHWGKWPYWLSLVALTTLLLASSLPKSAQRTAALDGAKAVDEMGHESTTSRTPDPVTV